jgi:hypothetical protein
MKSLRLLFLLMLPLNTSAQVTYFSNDFTAGQGAAFTTAGTIGTSPWQVTNSGADWGARIENGILELTNDASAAANAVGWCFASVNTTSDYSSGYQNILSHNTQPLEWAFNLQQIRTNPSGFTGSRYGVAYVLAASSSAVFSAGKGYAVVLGQNGSADALRLVSFNGGLSSLPNDGSGAIITAAAPLTNVGDEHLSVKVTFNPATNRWSLYGRLDGTSFLNPQLGTLSLLGTAVDFTHVKETLSFMGAYWQGNTLANQTAFFDNFTVKSQACPPVTWTGSVSSQWNVAGNWSNSEVPDALSSVLIPQSLVGSSPYPVLNGNETICALTVEPNANLTLSPAASLLVGDAIVNDGEIELQASSVGYSQLQLRGTYSGPGSVSQQQFLTGDGWHNVATPIENTSAGQFGLVGTNRAPLAENLFYWNADPNAVNPYQWQKVANNAEVLSNGLGYNAYFGPNGVQQSANQEYTLNVSGTPLTQVATPIFFGQKGSTGSPESFVAGNGEDGWNLVANPFTCALDFSSLNLNPATDFINNSFYIFNASNGTYSAYSAAGISSPEIAPLQSFFIQTTSASVGPNLNLNMRDHGLIANPAPAYFKTQNFHNKLVLEVHQQNKPQFKDETVLAFLPNTTTGFDGLWDAHKMLNLGDMPNLFTTHNNGDAMAINAINFDSLSTGSVSIPVAFTSKQKGAGYSLGLKAPYLLPGYGVWLEDKRNHSLTDLKKETYYFINLNSEEHRFNLHIATEGVPPPLQTHAQPKLWFDARGFLRVQMPVGSSLERISLYTLSGSLVGWSNPKNNEILKAPGPGIYLATVSTTGGQLHRVKLYRP